MTKELEALDEFLKKFLFLCEKLNTNMQEKMLLDSNSSYNILKKYLESIDNANPSEALERLEWISRELKTYYEHLYIILRSDKKELISNMKKINEYLETIKQALLKTQEPKQHLKWEDLEFEDSVWKNVEVVLNGTKYTLNCYKNCIEYTYVKIYLNGIVVADLCSTYKADKQFFNDLHLERVKK